MQISKVHQWFDQRVVGFKRLKAPNEKERGLGQGSMQAADGQGAASSSGRLRSTEEIMQGLRDSEKRLVESQHQFTRIFPKERAKYS